MGIELHDVIRLRLPLLFLATLLPGELTSLKAADKPRVIVTTDGEIDDECSMVLRRVRGTCHGPRFLCWAACL